MSSTKRKLLSSTMLPAVMGAGVAIAMSVAAAPCGRAASNRLENPAAVPALVSSSVNPEAVSGMAAGCCAASCCAAGCCAVECCAAGCGGCCGASLQENPEALPTGMAAGCCAASCCAAGCCAVECCAADCGGCCGASLESNPQALPQAVANV